MSVINRRGIWWPTIAWHKSRRLRKGRYRRQMGGSSLAVRPEDQA